MCKRIFSVMMIIIMLSTTNGVATFANAETPTEETTVGADTEETTVGADTEETTIGANCVSPEDETEDETTEDESNVGANCVSPDDEIEESQVEANSVSPEEETTEEEENETGSQAHPYDTTEDETEVDVEQDEVVKDIEYKANPTIKFSFTTGVSGVDTDSTYVVYGSAMTNHPDIDFSSSSFRNKNVGDPITAPTMVVDSTEASKGLSLRY